MRTFKEGYDEAKWLQYNVMSQALPNRLCALPSPQQRYPHANACLTCVNFRTHTLRNKNLDLKIKIKNLRTQLEAIYGELYKLKQDNKN